MSSPTDPRQSWQLGSVLISLTPFISLILVFTEPPTWLQIVGVVVIVALVWTGSSLIRRRAGGWRPSETLARHGDDGR